MYVTRTLVLLFAVTCKVLAEHLVVKGANHAVTASVGGEVILNCSVDSQKVSAPNELEEVSWKKIGHNGDIPVLLFQDNEVFVDFSHEIYEGRVEFFVTEIPKGNFSLKLKDIKMVDKGEFVCQVHTRNSTGSALVILQKLGFSMSHILTLALCFFALLFSVGLFIPIFILLRKKVTNGKVMMMMHISLIICPNICLGVAFILWSTEGTLTEIVTCSTISIIRPLLLMKTFPLLDRFPQRFTKAVKTFAVPVYHSILVITSCSIYSGNIGLAQKGSDFIVWVMVTLEVMCFAGAAILAGFSFRMHSIVVLQICNGAFLGYILINQSTQDFDASFQIPSILCPIIIGTLIVLSLQRHYFQGKPFRCAHIVLSSVILTTLSLAQIVVYILIGVSTSNFTSGWILSFEAVIHIVIWLSLIFLIRCHGSHKYRCCFLLRGTGYLCCTVIVVFLFTAFGALNVYYVKTHMKNTKDYDGNIALCAFLNVITVISLFKHPKHLSEIPHTVVHLFGAVVLTVVSSVTLITELNLKAGTAERQNVEDLRIIVLPWETVFIAGWIALQIYEFWMRMGQRIRQNFEDPRKTETQGFPEMETLTSGLKPETSENIPPL